MKSETRYNLYLLTLICLAMLVGILCNQLYHIKHSENLELNNLLEAERAINMCKNSYNQDYALRNDLVIEFTDGGSDE